MINNIKNTLNDIENGLPKGTFRNTDIDKIHDIKDYLGLIVGTMCDEYCKYTNSDELKALSPMEQDDFFNSDSSPCRSCPMGKLV